MMTIIHIIESLSNFGGTPRKLLYLTKYSEEKVCRHVFLCYLPSPLKEEFERHGAVVECLNTVSLLSLIRHTVRLAAKHRVDAICTHFTRPLLIGFAAAWAGHLPVIHNEHSSAAYRKGAGRLLSRFILPRISMVTCNSHYTMESVQRIFSVPCDRMSVIYNPVEQRACNAAKTEIRNRMGFRRDELIIGHVGGMIPQRDQKTLIHAFSRLKKIIPNARLVIVGDGSLRRHLEQLSSTSGIGDAVIFTGYTDSVGEYLRAMDIYVNPTLDEGFGIAVVEAMLECLPVVLSDRGAHPELLEDGVSGILYSGGDSLDLQRKLELLAGNQAMRAALGEKARQRALHTFHPQVYADNFMKVVSESVDSYRRASRARAKATV